jgi:DNA-binding response OmpR family regulator
MFCEIGEYLLWIDTQCIEKVFNNLLINAFKFTKEGDTITIRISGPAEAKPSQGIGEYIRIDVEDTGRGIPSEQLLNIFNRFYKVDDNVPGTGIGLSLAKSLVEFHRGMILAESELSEYTRFSVLLPTGDGHIYTQQKDDVSRIRETADTDFLVYVEPEAGKMNDATASLDSPEAEILFVDDNPEVLDFLQSIFERQYRVRFATNGLEALALIEESEPDVVISDVMMPVMDGNKFCKTLKTNPDTCHIPFILLTAKSAAENIIEGMEEGADDYVAKPFDPDILRARVRNLIDTRKKMIEKFRSGDEVLLHTAAKNSIDRIFIQTIQDRIMANINDAAFSVVDLGRDIGMSRTGFFRKIKAITGLSPNDFIILVRLQHAKKLLMKGDMIISEIGYEVSFQAPSSFSKSFRKQFGMSPSEYVRSISCRQEV